MPQRFIVDPLYSTAVLMLGWYTSQREAIKDRFLYGSPGSESIGPVSGGHSCLNALLTRSRPSVTREAEEEEGGPPMAIVMLDCWATDTKETPNRYGQRLSYRRQYHG